MRITISSHNIKTFKEILATEYQTLSLDPKVKTDNIKSSLYNWLVSKGYDIAIKALEIGAKFHTGSRKDKITPEFNHPLMVTKFIKALNLPDDYEEHVITAGILHDVVEDYPQALRLLIDFPLLIRRDVVLLSKVRGKNKLKTSSYYSNLSKGLATSIVKAMDRLHNVKTMTPFTKEKKVEYAKETFDFVFSMIDAASINFPKAKPVFDRIKRAILNELRKVFKNDGIPVTF